MIEKIIRNISQQMELQDIDTKTLRELLPYVIEGINEIDVSLNDERWVGLGVHLLSFARRIRENEYLDAVDESVLAQVGSDVFTVSRRVLEKYSKQFGREIDDTEALLLAVHFETARNNNK